MIENENIGANRCETCMLNLVGVGIINFFFSTSSSSSSYFPFAFTRAFVRPLNNGLSGRVASSDVELSNYETRNDDDDDKCEEFHNFRDAGEREEM